MLDSKTKPLLTVSVNILASYKQTLTVLCSRTVNYNQVICWWQRLSFCCSWQMPCLTWTAVWSILPAVDSFKPVHHNASHLLSPAAISASVYCIFI